MQNISVNVDFTSIFLSWKITDVEECKVGFSRERKLYVPSVHRQRL